MGRALYSASAAARDVFDRADRALGWSVKNLCFEGPEEDLVRTAFTQPALVTTSLAALAAVREAHPDLPLPAFAAGHSLGEYSALVAAGLLDLEDAVRLVHLRGKAMQVAVPEGLGGMAAVMATADEVVELCAAAAGDDVLSPANFNAPGQIVIAGHAAAVERALSLAQERKLRAVPLKVSAPFHCSLMAPAASAMRAALAEVPLGAAAFPVVANVDASPNSDPARARELLVQQVDGPVRWEQSVKLMASLGVRKAIEFGPGRVLAGLVRRIDKSIEVLSVGDVDGIGRVPAFLA